MLQVPTEEPPYSSHGRPIHDGRGGTDAREAAALVFAQLLSAVKRRRVPLILCLVLLPLLTWLGLQQVTPKYTATGSAIYEPASYAMQPLQSILRTDPVSDEVIASQAELVRSLRAAQQLADQFHLVDNPEFNWTLRPPSFTSRAFTSARRTLASWLGHVWPAAAGWVAPPVVQPPTAAQIRQWVVESVEAATVVKPLAQSHVLNVSFTAEDPVLAAKATNALLSTYIDSQLQTKFDAVRNADKWLEKREQELQIEVRNWDDKIAAYQTSHGLTQGVQAGLSTEEVSRLSNNLIQARDELAQAEGRLDAARGKQGSAAQAAVSPSVVALRAQEDSLSAQLQSLLTRRGPNYPDVISLRRQLGEVRRAVGAETGRVSAASVADVRADRAKVASLEGALKQAQEQVSQHAQAQIPLKAMQRDADASRHLLQAVLASIQQIAQQTAIEKPDARIISQALPPTFASSPKTTLLMAASVVFALCFGALIVYLLEISDSAMRTGEDVRHVLGLPCFALIPQIRTSARGRLRADNYVVRKPLSLFAEQMRALRAAFWLGSAAPRVIAIAAARPMEGKTTTSIALARSAALNGERVILLDCDLRKPSVARSLEDNGGPGIVDLLSGRSRLEQVIRRDKLTKLDYIPAGNFRQAAAGLFMSQNMTACLEQLRRTYDLVVLDLPPVFAMADARIVSSLADATLLCVRWRSTPQRIARHSLGMLQEANANVVGVALTRVDLRVHANAGYTDSEVYHPRYHAYYHE